MMKGSHKLNEILKEKQQLVKIQHKNCLENIHILQKRWKPDKNPNNVLRVLTQ